MRPIKFFGFAILLLMLSACATGPTLEESADTMPPIPTGKGRVFFYRGVDFSAGDDDVLLDGEKAGNALMGGVFFKDVLPGRHRATTVTNLAWPIVEFNVSAGEKKYIKLVGGRYRVSPELVNAKTGEADVADLHRTGPNARPGRLSVVMFGLFFLGIPATVILCKAYINWRNWLFPGKSADS